MLKKIFKTIFVLSICVGISLPTNAAVSVSDGSAFVTKAEFAADLNNLSNRMAQLENSLDAKIDSLVSSYLTRNGIWNGAIQEILGKTKTFTAMSQLQASINAKLSVSKVIWEESFLANKTGLLFVNLSLKLNKSNSDSWKSYIMSSTDYSGNDSNKNFSIIFSDQSGNTIYYNQPFISSYAISNKLIMGLPMSANYVIQCFVPKDYVIFKMVDTWTNSYATTLSLRTDTSCFVGGGNIVFKFETANIY